MKRYFDPSKNCLVYVGTKANESFWEKSWESKDLKNDILSRRFDFLVTPTTKKYLKSGARILEGGCGKGEYVHLLTKAGYKCIGVDTAKATITKTKKVLPDLDVRFGDVRKLNFPDNYFAGYWSLGVIEHFFTGFQPVLNEMRRVLRPKGFLFVTFPYMSPLRTIKSKLGLYPVKLFKTEPKKFYQFALDQNEVIAKIGKAGFHLVSKRPFDGFKGLKDEMEILAFILDPISKLAPKNIIFGGMRLLLDKIFVRFSGHVTLLIFKRVG